MHAWRLALSIHGPTASRDEIGQKRSKICIIISYHIFLLGNDTLENDTDNEKLIHRKQNHQIENMSISIDNGASNRKHRNQEWTYMQDVDNQMSDQQSNMNITACPYYNHLWLTTTKFCSQQVSVTAANLSARLLAMVASASWGLRVEIWSYIRRVVLLGHVGPRCYLGLWAIRWQFEIPTKFSKQKRSIHVFGGIKTLSFPFPPTFSYFHTFSGSYHFHFIVSHIFRKRSSVDREFP
jgi:hypothetical protein